MADNKREALKGVYPAEKWQQKVSSMTEGQVNAIFLRLRSQGKV
jgi:hypothetical protein